MSDKKTLFDVSEEQRRQMENVAAEPAATSELIPAEPEKMEVANPFLAAPAPEANAISEAASQREFAEVQAAMVVAKKFPRNQKQAMDAILKSCTRHTLAASALYEYSRGGTAITGPSIRLAESIAQHWGNLQFGIRELDQRDGESTVEAYAWDLETNTRQSKVFQVKHERYTKHGSYSLEDPRDIYETVANQGARRLRACILGVIPGDVIEAAVQQIEATNKDRVKITAELLKNLLDKFAEFNVTKQQIEARIQRSFGSISVLQVNSLGKIYNSMKDGMSSPADWFTAEAVEKSSAEQAKERLRKG